MKSSNCYCNSTRPYSECCEPFHLKKAFPETAEQLMRSRYSAYAVNKIEYIANTNDPSSKEGFDQEAAEAWAKESEWLGLEIVATRAGDAKDSEGEVEFKATYKADDETQVHHEVSLFRRLGASKHWFYIDGKTVRAPVARAEPKVGRNDPCSCGSGKKFKKCCAA